MPRYDKNAPVAVVDTSSLEEPQALESQPVDTPAAPPPEPVLAPTPMPPPAPPVVMQLAHIFLKRNDLGDNVPLGERETPYGLGFEPGVTPAEAQLLRAQFQTAAKGDPVTQIIIKGAVRRTYAQEKHRLLAQYGRVTEKLFPGINPVMPCSFSDIADPSMMPSPTAVTNPMDTVTNGMLDANTGLRA